MIIRGSDRKTKGHMIDRVLLEELWVEICNTVQEVDQTINKKRNATKAKWLFMETLQIAEKQEN